MPYTFNVDTSTTLPVVPSGLGNNKGPDTGLVATYDGRNLAVVATSEEAAQMVKLHKVLPADEIGLTKYGNKIQRVTGETFKNLELAQKTVWTTKALLPFGAGNMFCDFLATGGENHLRLKMARNSRALDLSPQMEKFRPAITQGGNCGEHGLLSFAQLISEESLRNTPVGLCAENGVDHCYVVIGDHREIGKEKTVVADAWVIMGGAHTLNQGCFNDPVVTEWKPRGLVCPNNYEELSKKSTLSSDQVSMGLDNKTLLNIFGRDRSHLWEQWTAANDPSTLYWAPGTEYGAKTFDDVPVKFFQRKLEGHNEAIKYGWFNKDAPLNESWRAAPHAAFKPDSMGSHPVLATASFDSHDGMPIVSSYVPTTRASATADNDAAELGQRAVASTSAMKDPVGPGTRLA